MAFHGMSLERGVEQQLCIKQQVTVVWETILVFSISNLAVSFWTSDPALCILMRFLETP